MTWRRFWLARLEWVPPKRLLTVLMAALALAGCNGNDESEDADRTSAPPSPTQTVEQANGARGGQPSAKTVVTGLEAPWELAFLPDGRALVTERPGRVRLLSKELKLRAEPAAEVDVAATGESGLLGLAVDPDFERNSFVYLYRTTDSGNEVLRYRFEDGRLEEDARVLDGLQAGAIHDGGRLRFGPDGLLYVTTGEAGNQPLAQDPDSLNGKVLRLRGFRGGGAKAEIVSSGHRNVQGLDWEPGTGRLVITEFGPDSDDEVNVIRKGANYGWPEAQGDEGGPEFEEPAVNYEDVIAPSGGTFVREEGSAWTGSLVFAALRGEQLRRVKLDGDKTHGERGAVRGRLRAPADGDRGPGWGAVRADQQHRRSRQPARRRRPRDPHSAPRALA